MGGMFLSKFGQEKEEFVHSPQRGQSEHGNFSDSVQIQIK